MIAGLRSIPGVVVYGTADPELQMATVAFNIEGIAPSEVGLRLDEEYGVLCRVGLHCAPAAHRTMGTFPDGTVRFSLGAFSTTDQVGAAVGAIEQLSAEVR
jgi:selenocysteine lyase/cysteine desulfurase